MGERAFMGFSAKAQEGVTARSGFAARELRGLQIELLSDVKLEDFQSMTLHLVIFLKVVIGVHPHGGMRTGSCWHETMTQLCRIIGQLLD